MGVGSGSSVAASVGVEGGVEVCAGVLVGSGVSVGAGVAVGGMDVWVGDTIVGVGGSGVDVEIGSTDCNAVVGRIQNKYKKSISKMIVTINLNRS